MAYRNRRFTNFAWVAALSLCCGVLLLWPGGSDAQNNPPQRAPKGKLSSVPAEHLDWPLPPGIDKSFDSIDANKLHRYVQELAAISIRDRDRGNQFWGRIAGMPSGTESQNWIKEKFKEIGVPYDTVTIPSPSDFPKSWGIDVSSNGKSIHLKSAFPLIDFPETTSSAKGDHELDTVWVSLGQASDFLGKDVRGKAVFIYSIPTPSVLIQSAMWMESVGRAQRAGAAAIIVDVALPGNMQYVSHMVGGRVRDIKVPIFTIGEEDGRTVEQLNAAAQGVGLKTHLRWEVGHYPDLKQDIVIGKLPGMTDENMVMLAHMDGFFEGATDNGAGIAAMLGAAEYFAKVPKEKRRRTLYFVSLLDHHSNDRSGKWLHENFQSIFAKTAVIVNSEHPAVFDAVLDRRWGSNDRPSIIPTNAHYPSWWGVYGSERLARLVVRDFATFGVPTQIAAGGAEGELTQVQFDAPSFYIDNKGIFFHTDADTPDKVPVSALKNAVQAFVKIYDDINTLDLKDLQAPPSERPGAASLPSTR
jgi:peptidase M28-like protein